METRAFLNFVKLWGWTEVKTGKGICAGNPHNRNITKHGNSGLLGPTCIDSHLVPKFNVIDGTLPS